MLTDRHSNHHPIRSSSRPRSGRAISTQSFGNNIERPHEAPSSLLPRQIRSSTASCGIRTMVSEAAPRPSDWGVTDGHNDPDLAPRHEVSSVVNRFLDLAATEEDHNEVSLGDRGPVLLQTLMHPLADGKRSRCDHAGRKAAGFLAAHATFQRALREAAQGFAGWVSFTVVSWRSPSDATVYAL